MYGRQPAGSPEAPLSASSCLGRPRASESQLALALALSLTRSLSDLGADPAARRATSDMIAEHGMRLIPNPNPDPDPNPNPNPDPNTNRCTGMRLILGLYR